MTGVSVVIPLRNGARFIRETLQSIWAQRYEPIEVIVVDDGSTDGGLEIVREFVADHAITTLQGDRWGAAAAMNKGLHRARYPIICQIDQDVVLKPGWIAALTSAFTANDVAAAQGIYVTDTRARLLSRVMSRDLEDRYAAIESETDHVCTGNVAYRADALRRVAYFDETLGYGYDNDLSYRLRSAGYRLIICKEAQSLHRWRDDVAGYFRQQYGFGYGRLDVVAKHPGRVRGDAVSPSLMMLHPLLLILGVVGMATSPLVSNGYGLWILGAAIVAFLVIERAVAGARAAHRFNDLTPFWFPVIHLLRDIAWVCAIVVWSFRRVAGIVNRPSHSMRARSATADLPPSRPRGASASLAGACGGSGKVGTTTASGVVQAFRPAVAVPIPPAESSRGLIVIPAFNEGSNLRPVVNELRATIPNAEILVVDDGSTDGTDEVLETLNVRSVRLPQRMGIGTAMRVGLRYAVRQGFGLVARLDGDGQHRPQDVLKLLDAVKGGSADIAFGSRGLRRHGTSEAKGILKRPLAACLSLLTRRRVLDATCGLSAMGPRAIRLLSECHPTGYPEPELRLLVSRTTLTAIDVNVGGRPRLNGSTSLTPLRVMRAAARIALAICVVPLRPAETEPAGE